MLLRNLLAMGGLTALILMATGCETEVAPSLFADYPFEYQSKPVGDPSITPYEAGDPAQVQIWIKPPPTLEELQQRAAQRGGTPGGR